ncbi:MAG: alcohol dehydrogenase catalytic domain-containing protein, partial [Burkholderiaceae bacterium]
MEMIRAAVLRSSGVKGPYVQTRPLSFESVALEPPGFGELRVKIRAASLCHSDLSAVNGDRPWPVPLVLGHEAAGRTLEFDRRQHLLGPVAGPVGVGGHERTRLRRNEWHAGRSMGHGRGHDGQCARGRRHSRAVEGVRHLQAPARRPDLG